MSMCFCPECQTFKDLDFIEFEEREGLQVCELCALAIDENGISKSELEVGKCQQN